MKAFFWITDRNNGRWLVKSGINWKTVVRKTLIIQKTRCKWIQNKRKIFTQKTVNSSGIKLLFTINTTWQTTCKNCWKTLRISYSGAIHPSKWTIQKNYSMFILKLKIMYRNPQFSQSHFHINATALWNFQPSVGLLQI